MNYNEMTDFEINKAVAVVLGYPEENCEYGWFGKPDVGVEWDERTGYPTKSFDFCNSWADAGRIIEENKITLAFDGGEWWADSAAYWVDGNEWQITGESHHNPLRAAMQAFLKWKEPTK